MATGLTAPKRKRRPSGKYSGPAYAEAERRVADAIAKSADGLDLTIMGLTRLPSLTGLTALETLLILDVTEFSDLTSIVALISLQFLDLQGTQVSDLTPLAGLTGLQSLDLERTQVSDLTPLAGLTGLQSLYLTECEKVSDLTPLAGLTGLQSLNLYRTQVSDLTPLAGLTGLQSLDLRATKVSDLTPLAGLTGLQSLNLRATKVSDLTPLAELTGLIDGAQKKDVGGLWFNSDHIADEKLRAFAELGNPKRTIKTINYLREQQGLAPYDPKSPKGENQPPVTEPPKATPKPPPKLPKQGAGQHYAVRSDGVIDVAPPPPLDSKGNHVARLRAMHEPLRDAAHDLLDRLAPNANSYPRLYSVTQKYCETISRPTSELDFTSLYALGVRLDAAVALTERDIANNNAPKFDNDQAETLRAVRLLHGPFILASADGRKLVSDAERYLLADKEEQILREDSAKLAREMEARPDVATQRVADGIAQSAEAISDGPHKKRASNLTLHQISNFAVAAGETSIITLLGIHVGAEGITTLGGAWVFLSNFPEGKQALKTGKEILSRMHKSAVDSLSTGVVRFMLATEPIWRRLASVSPRLGFVNHLFDWIKDQQLPNL